VGAGLHWFPPQARELFRGCRVSLAWLVSQKRLNVTSEFGME